MESVGLREKKKQQTREAIAAAAMTLFAERGFEAVTVAEVARSADVSTATVFNYFPTKEDLVYGRLEVFENELLAAVRSRPAGVSVLDAFERFIIERSRSGSGHQRSDRVAKSARIIAASPALLARERQIVGHHADALAGLVAEEIGADADDIRPRVAAGALMAVHRSLIDYARQRALAGRLSTGLSADIEAEAQRAFTLLAHGLGDYAAKPPDR